MQIPKMLVKFVYLMLSYMRWFQELNWFTKSRDGEPVWKNWKFWVSILMIVAVVILEIGLFPLDSVWAQTIAFGLLAAALFGFEIPRPMFDKDQEFLDGIHYNDDLGEEDKPEPEKGTRIVGLYRKNRQSYL